jgi:transcriptional regulator with XRE-family HTH domain
VNGKPSSAAGDYLRTWRRRRQMSQMSLALVAQISQRHLSFLESGRAMPSREMLIRLTQQLEVPLRERNAILLAAGFAPGYAERTLDDPAMTAARSAIDRVLKGHEPYPALAIDRHWNLVAANAALAPLLVGIADRKLLDPPVNVLRLSLHPDGLAARIANLSQWRAALNDDPVLERLLSELSAYPANDQPAAHSDGGDVFVPLQLMSEDGMLSFISTTTLFGTPRDVTLSELAIEALFPGDARTAAVLHRTALL